MPHYTHSRNKKGRRNGDISYDISYDISSDNPTVSTSLRPAAGAEEYLAGFSGASSAEDGLVIFI